MMQSTDFPAEIFATAHGVSVSQPLLPGQGQIALIFITNKDYTILNSDRVLLAKWIELTLNYKMTHIPFFSHYSEVEELKDWIRSNVDDSDCLIYVFAGGLQHHNETPGGRISIIMEELILATTQTNAQ